MDDSSTSVPETSAHVEASTRPSTRTQLPRSTPPVRAASGRKRSLQLSLVLISVAALGGCGNLENNENLSRDVYANMEACKADWGTPGDCEEINPSTRSTLGGHSYYGPRYYSRSGSYGYSSTARPGSRSAGTVSASPSRGGFGASSSRHSGSSSHSSGG